MRTGCKQPVRKKRVATVGSPGAAKPQDPATMTTKTEGQTIVQNGNGSITLINVSEKTILAIVSALLTLALAAIWFLR